jgi:quinol monooxygenase YgiN
MEAIELFVASIATDEPETLSYESFLEGDGVSFLQLMRFRDEVAERYHHDTPHMRELLEALHPLCEEPPTFSDVILVAAARHS